MAKKTAKKKGIASKNGSGKKGTASQQTVKSAGYRKHQAPAKWDVEVIKSTKNGPARYKPGLPQTEAQLDMEFSSANPIPKSNGILWKKMPYIVGASEGVETSFLLFKVNSGLVHARPVSPAELRRWGVKVK